ncbi:MAG: hypothetical protein O8C62_04415 [Candidatus Methanoperedens sp.]|nr:hypothetical protein [Candidatus Methanoperedens sp.]
MEKFGKMGIPGFRSGKWWKMVIATSVYLIAIASIYLVASAFISVLTSPAEFSTSKLTNKPTTQLQTPTPTVTKSIEQIKKEVVTTSYDDLMRNNEDYIGKTVFFRVNVVQVNEISNNNYVLIVATNNLELLWVNYKGKRVLIGDVVDIWGEVKGLKTYIATYGGTLTVPQLYSLNLELVEKAGGQ